VIGLFGVLLYFGLLCAGFVEFRSRISRSSRYRNGSRNRMSPRKLRDIKARGMEQ